MSALKSTKFAYSSLAATNQSSEELDEQVNEKVDRKNKMDADTSIKMYIVVNNSLKMGKGKIAGQVGHAVAGITRRMERQVKCSFAQLEVYNNWVENNEAKIVLKADEEVLDTLRAKYSSVTHAVHDLGKTQIAGGSFTALAFIPLPPQGVPAELKSLKLLS